MQAQTTITARQRVDDSHLSAQLHPVIRQLYAARGVTDPAQIDNSVTTLHDFRLFRDIDKAAELLFTSLQKQEKVLIVGDFDADGATSTATLMQGLQGAYRLVTGGRNRF